MACTRCGQRTFSNTQSSTRKPGGTVKPATVGQNEAAKRAAAKQRTDKYAKNTPYKRG